MREIKFKTKEELIREDSLGYFDERFGGNLPKAELNIESREHNNKVKYIYNKAFKSFAERIAFYKRYKNSMTLFYNDHPNIYKQMKDVCLNKNNGYAGPSYENWLFNYCFGDIE